MIAIVTKTIPATNEKGSYVIARSSEHKRGGLTIKVFPASCPCDDPHEVAARQFIEACPPLAAYDWRRANVLGFGQVWVGQFPGVIGDIPSQSCGIATSISYKNGRTESRRYRRQA